MLVEITYSQTGKKETLKVSGNKILFGRSPKADVSINRDEISRHHFQLDIENGQYYITDLNSSNGVFINGEKLHPQTRLPYNIFFPIDIANLISINIIEDPEAQRNLTSSSSVSKLGQQTPNKSSSTSAKKKEITQIGRTKIIKNQATKKKSSSLQLLFSLLILFSIPLYFFLEEPSEKSENVEAPPLQRQLEKSVDQPVESTPWPKKSEVTKIDTGSNISYAYILEKSDCSQFGKDCSQLGLTNPKESIGLYDGMLFLFINLDFIPEKSLHPRTKLLPLKKLAEFYLAQRSTGEAFQNVLRNQAPSSLNIIGFNIVKDQPQFKYRLVINFIETPPLDREIHRFLFHNIFYKGDFDLYQHYIGHYAEIADIQ
jgi:pSer/pThr/pTyr-binding forkhead associated (FHA) protein